MLGMAAADTFDIPAASRGIGLTSMRIEGRGAWLLRAILLLGMVLRVAYALEQPTLEQYTGAGGGDSSGYLASGAGFFSGKEHGWIRDIPFYNSNLKPAPLYVIFVGVFQVFLPDHEAIIAIRLVQCLASIATALMAFRLATIVSGKALAGLIAASLVALHPAFVAEPAQIGTETLYIFFLALGLASYIETIAGFADGWRGSRIGEASLLALSAAAFGMATLTRGVSALFPVVLLLHLFWLSRRKVLRGWRSRALLLLIVYAAVVSTWTVYNLVSWNRFIIISDQMMGALWRGAERNDGTPEHNDRLLLEGVEVNTPPGCEVDCKYNHSTATYVSKIAAIVSADLGGYLALRFEELAYSILQPHGTTPFGDISVVGAGREWLFEDRSLEGFARVLQIEGFAIKLTFWIFHYVGIGFGLLGMLSSRNRWVTAAPLVGFLLYTIAVHFFLLALPRYLFPVELVWVVFAGIALGQLYERRGRRV